ncbi:von Willebrand factor type A domain-containing protein [Nemania serpens]|nr:von Willebrand factor type A domain-containing protein [Nemania serpens]
MVYTNSSLWGQTLCGCWCFLPSTNNSYAPRSAQRSFLPLQQMQAHTTIKDVSSRTVLTQTFLNDGKEHLKDIVYSFPLYDGVSVVSFAATVGDIQIQGVVREKEQARREYQDAVDKGQSAGLLEQLPEASDVFVTKIGNVPAGATVIIEIIYIGELRHDAEANGTRFTIPSSIAPRYGSTPGGALPPSINSATDAIRVVVDFQSPEGCQIQQIQSPSHLIAVSVGRTTDMSTDAYMANRASATLSLDNTALDKAFVVIASVRGSDVPKALLETHATIPNQRALMATLVPRFNLTPTYGEIVFIVDRSGSMQGKMDMAIRAMTILLKSLPIGSKFNICSFGTGHSFLWPRSKSYNDATLSEALAHIDAFTADFGGTEIYEPVQATISQRFSDMLLDAIILTDGQIWNQANLFDMIKKASEDCKCRFFSLGIGSGASTALIEGIATAGNGASQFVTEGEKMDKKMVRLLKGALTPHIDDYSLEVKYKQDDHDFEFIESVKEASMVDITVPTNSTSEDSAKAPLSFFDSSLDPDRDGDVNMTSTQTNNDKFGHLPKISPPSILQAPYRIPPLYPFSRTTVYLLLDPSTYHRTPEAIILRATAPQGPIELEIKVEDIGKGETIHQLAAKKAVSELEKDGGWLTTAMHKVDNTLIKNKYDGRWEELVEREAVRLGVIYQIAGKWCSFVALEGDMEHEVVVLGEKASPHSGALFGRSRHAMPMGSQYAPSATTFGSSTVHHYDPPAAHSYDLYAPVAKKSPSFRKRNVAASHTSSATGAEAFNIPESKLEREDSQQQPSNSQDDDMHKVILLQKSNGSWDWDQLLARALGVSLASEKQNAVVATALAIAFLQKRMDDEAETWELIVEKAKAWLGQQDGVDVEKEISDAGKLLW